VHSAYTSTLAGGDRLLARSEAREGLYGGRVDVWCAEFFRGPAGASRGRCDSFLTAATALRSGRDCVAHRPYEAVAETSFGMDVARATRSLESAHPIQSVRTPTTCSTSTSTF
jgi:hypothetical protein